MKGRGRKGKKEQMISNNTWKAKKNTGRGSMKRRKEKLMSLLIDANKKSIPCLSRSR